MHADNIKVKVVSSSLNFFDYEYQIRKMSSTQSNTTNYRLSEG